MARALRDTTAGGRGAALRLHPACASTSRLGAAAVSVLICSREELAGITVHRQALHHHSGLYSVPSTWSCWVYQSGGAEFPAPLLWLWMHEEPKGQRNVSQEDKAYFKERGKENAPRSRLHLAFVLVVTWRKAESQSPRRLLSSETELGDVNRGEYAPHSGLWVHAGTP